jgi:hypothetical protein
VRARSEASICHAARVGAAIFAGSALRGKRSELLQIKVMFELVKRLVADLVTPMQSNQLGPPDGDRGKHNIEMRGKRPGECCIIARIDMALIGNRP